MDADGALALINDELARNGQPPINLTVEQSQQAFASLQAYARYQGVSLEIATRDLVRFQMQSIELEYLRRQS